MSDAKQRQVVLQVEDVCLSYGARRIVENLSLSVFQGEIFGLIGLNGVGKTTLIKAILALRNMDSGTILIDGKERNAPGSRKKVAFLPERFEPPWFLSGLEFLRFSMSLYGVSCPDDTVFLETERLALDPGVLKNRVQTYSKGMRQKLGLLATMLTGCPLLVLDEPMSGLDPKARSLVKDMLLESRIAGRTVFLSSHILSDMEEMCDRVAVLSNRTLVFTGNPDSLKQKGGNENMERAFLKVIES